MAVTASWRALGTTATLVVEDGDLPAARAAVEDLLGRVDRACSRFRTDSELVRVNALAGQWVPVSQLLADALEAALRGARLTDGLVDPTVGRAMRLVGYDDDFDRLADRDEPISLRLEPIPGWRVVELDASARRVRAPAGVELDLGSTGKGYAADLAAGEALRAGGAAGVLVGLGGDIAVAGEPPEGGWQVLVAEDSAAPPEAAGEVVSLRAGGMATSSTTVRRWIRGGIDLHHLIDPRSGAPADSPWRTATVAAATCLDANIAATAAIVMGATALDWLTAAGLPARLVDRDGSHRVTPAWPVGEEAAA